MLRWAAARGWLLARAQPSAECAWRAFSTPAAPAAAAAAGAHAAIPRPAPTLSRRVRQLMREYRQLSKARLSALVVATSGAGYVGASGAAVDWPGLGWTVAGSALCAASANALNQVYEVATDRLMRRTAARPLPSGRMGRGHALAFAAATGLAGVGLLAAKTNGLTAGLGAGNIVLYAGVYTPLKVVSVANTWVGAAVGAVPPLMGWAAASGGLDAGAAILALGLYFWQLPHFMAIAWLSRADYAAGGHRMLSLLDPTGKRVAACALRNCFYLFPLGILAAWLGVTSPYFAYESAFVTAGMTLCAAKFTSSPTTANARLLLRASLLHLPIFMGAFLLHRQPNTSQDRPGLLWDQATRLGLARARTEGGGGASTAWAGSTAPRASLFGWRMDEEGVAPPVSLMVAPRIGGLPSLRCPSVALAQGTGSEDRAGDDKEKPR
ncbi:COX10 [Auxenochlorella protothecoides x Auxenochlorella symbiontica]